MTCAIAPMADRSDDPFMPGDALILADAARGGWADSLPRRPWIVVACACEMCARGSHVAVDVPNSAAMLELYPELGAWRHIAIKALRRRGELSRARADAWANAVALPDEHGGFCIAQSLAWETEMGRDDCARVMRHEIAALALADALGTTEPIEQQASQLERWRGQRGGKPL